MLTCSDFVKKLQELQNDPRHGVFYRIEYKKFVPNFEKDKKYGFPINPYHRIRELNKAVANRIQSIQRLQENVCVEVGTNTAEEEDTGAYAGASSESSIIGKVEGGGEVWVADPPANAMSNADEAKNYMYQQGQKSEHMPKKMVSNSVASLVESHIVTVKEEPKLKDEVNSADSGIHGIGGVGGEVWVACHPSDDTSNAEEDKEHMYQQDQKLEHRQEILHLTQFISGANEHIKPTQARCDFLLKLGNQQERCL